MRNLDPTVDVTFSFVVVPCDINFAFFATSATLSRVNIVDWCDTCLTKHLAREGVFPM